jgi:hypothetical protein
MKPYQNEYYEEEGSEDKVLLPHLVESLAWMQM